MKTHEALFLVLDQIDYTQGACGPTEPISALITPETLAMARLAAVAARDQEGATLGQAHAPAPQPVEKPAEEKSAAAVTPGVNMNG
jgi:hypothetical protein